MLSTPRQAALPQPTSAWQPSVGEATSVTEAAWGIPSTWIDLAKALASQLIIWHHLALYGPMCDVARSLAPALMDVLLGQARLVVQVFLVTGGFLAAGSLWPSPGQHPGVTWRSLPGSLWRRYQRLAKPYLMAVLAVIVAAWVARGLVDHPTIPAAPEPGQLAAHMALLQDVMGYESLSAGFWYVAIDFQLFGLLALLAVSLRFLGGRATERAAVVVAVVVALVLLSLLRWNLDPSFEAYAPYFFGAYGLGVLARWARSHRGSRGAAALGLVLIVGLALIVHWRTRIALAGATAVLLCLAPEPARLRAAPLVAGRALLGFLSRVSYSTFLMHYPVILVTGAVVNAAWPDSPAINAAGMVLAWMLSIAAGAGLHWAVERRR